VSRRRTRAERIALMVEAHLDLVSLIARSVKRLLPPSVDFEELEQAGRVGLWQAAGRYQPGRRIPFRAYAQFRIRGAMLDTCRRADFAWEWHEPLPDEDGPHKLVMIDGRRDPIHVVVASKQLNVVLLRALDKLPYVLRKVAIARANDKGYAEIGASMGRSSTWAFYRYQEALELLRADPELKRAA
jgi:RNA polymerase sigma factor (sigma-70 family)